jgi:hypothetical protein
MFKDFVSSGAVVQRGAPSCPVHGLPFVHCLGFSGAQERGKFVGEAVLVFDIRKMRGV